MTSQGPKITVIGAGSYFFAGPIIWEMASSPVMAGGTLALVDLSPKVLATIARLARKAFAHTKCGVRVIADTDRRKVLRDSDFVILTFSKRNSHYRGLDTAIAAKHGIRMCSSDTIGPGGIFRALRELPEAIAIARDCERLCRDAWVINFVNPTAVMGIGLRRFAPKVRSFALCDGNHEPYNTLNFCKKVNLISQDATSLPPRVARGLDLRIAGVNHCTWLTRFRFEGKDMMPALRRMIVANVKEEARQVSEKSKPRYNWHYALQLFDLYGAYPTAISHTKEYVPFFQGYGVLPNFPEPIRLFDGVLRQREMDRAWQQMEQYARGDLPLEQFLKRPNGDHASEIIESMWGQMGKPFFINTFNGGAVTNLPPDAFLELRCDIDMQGPRPQPFGEMPRGLLALQHELLDTHELTAQAAMTGDRALLKRAMLTDPICNNLRDAEACIKELLEAERDVLPDYWR